MSARSPSGSKGDSTSDATAKTTPNATGTMPDTSKLIYRVAGIPPVATIDDLKTRLFDPKYCSADERLEIEIKGTISPSCYDTTSQVALIRFSKVPGYLCAGKQWQIISGGWNINIDTHFEGFTQLYPTAPGVDIKADIIAVTGLDGHAYGSWRGRGNLQEMWLRDFFCDQFADCRTMIYGYNSKLENDRGFHQLDDFACGLLSAIENVRVSYEERKRPIIFIGHSLGGVIITQALIKSKDSLSGRSTPYSLIQNTYATVFFATPHRGIGVENILSVIDKDSPRRPLLQSIQGNGRLLVQNCEAFIEEVKKNKFTVISFYEQQQSRKLEKDKHGRPARSGEHYTALDRGAACLSPGEDLEIKIPVDKNHSDIVKFESRYEFAYTSLYSRLKQILLEARGLRVHDCPTATCAVQHDNLIALEWICQHKQAVVNERQSDGETLLHMAARGGNTEIVCLLLMRNADIRAIDKYQRSVLHVAASNGHTEVVAILLERGADIEAEDEHEEMALHYAASNGHENVVAQLLEKGASVDAQSRYGKTALQCAVSNGHEKIVGMLIEKGANTEVKDENDDTALLVAAHKGYDKAVVILLKRGASIGAQGKYGQTALHYAAAGGHEKVVKILLERGADIEAQNAVKRTAVVVAALGGHERVVNMLLKSGAKI